MEKKRKHRWKFIRSPAANRIFSGVARQLLVPQAKGTCSANLNPISPKSDYRMPLAGGKEDRNIPFGTSGLSLYPIWTNSTSTFGNLCFRRSSSAVGASPGSATRIFSCKFLSSGPPPMVASEVTETLRSSGQQWGE